MGQYHHPVCIEAEEGLKPSGMDNGLKEGEQGFSRPGTPSAIVALVCARGGNMPADCSQSPLVGRWAGKRVVVQGDYAEDSDVQGWQGPPLSTLYRAMTPPEERRPKKDWRRTPLYADITREARDFLEAACNIRYFEQEQVCTDAAGKVLDRWINVSSVRVKPVARHYGNCGIAEYVIADGYSQRDLEYLKRRGMKPEDVMRPPRSGDWHGTRPEEISEGQKRLIVNLDTLEYLDPVKFGQVPTLGGMLADRGPPPWPKVFEKADPNGISVIDVAGGLFVMLCHPERRGGGDIPANADQLLAAVGSKDDRARRRILALFRGTEDVKGRWRGGHILGTGEIRYEGWPTTEEVIARGTDISDKVLRYLVAVSHY
jgi:hypothetical protein